MGRMFCVLAAVVAAVVLFTATDGYCRTHGKRHAMAAKHRVKRGETLYSLARQHGVSMKELKRANHLKGDRLSAGLTLRIPRRGRAAGHSKDRLAASMPEVSGKTGSVMVADTPAKPSMHVVQGGETLYSLARTYGMGLSDFKKLNHIKGNRIKVGQELVVPGVTVAEADKANASNGISPDASSETSNVTVDGPLTTEQMGDGLFSDAAVLDITKRYEGIPYRFGGSGQGGIDCSGFTRSVFDSYGLELPRSAREQFRIGEPVAKSELKRGDLVFFRTYARYPSHVGIYVGDGRFIHMSTSKGEVEITGLDDSYYVSCYLGARRVLSEQ